MSSIGKEITLVVEGGADQTGGRAILHALR